MTAEELVEKIERLLRKELEGANIGRVDSEDIIGVEIDDGVWFIEITEA